MQTLTHEEIELQGIDTDLPGTVILHNDDFHSFNDVINQLILAIRCSLEKAQIHTHEVHTKGQSRVYNGALELCLEVSSVLEEINLKTTIEI